MPCRQEKNREVLWRGTAGEFGIYQSKALPKATESLETTNRRPFQKPPSDLRVKMLGHGNRFGISVLWSCSDSLAER